MTRRRAASRRITWVVMVLAVTVCALATVSLRRPFLKRWFLQEFRSAEGNARVVAARNLANVAGVGDLREVLAATAALRAHDAAAGRYCDGDFFGPLAAFVKPAERAFAIETLNEALEDGDSNVRFAAAHLIWNLLSSPSSVHGAD